MPSKKTIFITGASSGIGHATAVRLHEAGHTVFGAARRIERMADLQQRGVKTLAVDVTDDASMRQAVDRLLDMTQGRLDVLVNNAGYGSYGALEDVPPEEARRQFDVNIFGLARMTQLVLPVLRGQGQGRIVNIASIGGKIYEPLGAWYHATKYAVEGLSDCLRLELAPFGIDVVVIEPGLIKTEWPEIAMQNLQKTSGDGPYGGMVKCVNGFFARMQTPGFLQGSDPDVIALVIEKAVTAKRPRPRYAAGRLSRIALTGRRWLSDRMFDRVTKLMLGIK